MTNAKENDLHIFLTPTVAIDCYAPETIKFARLSADEAKNERDLAVFKKYYPHSFDDSAPVQW